MKDMGMDMSGMQGMEGMDMSAGMGSTRGVDPTAEQNASGKLATGVAAAVASQTGMAGMDHSNMQGMPGDSGTKQGMDHSAMGHGAMRSEEHTSELQSLMRNSYAVFCLKKNKVKDRQTQEA